MSLSTNLQSTASRLLVSYGDSIVLSKVTKSGTYNPAIAGGYADVVTSYNDKAYIKQPTIKDLELAGIDTTLQLKVSGVATIAYKSDYSAIDNTWSINGIKVSKVIKTSLQDNAVVLKVFF